ncbi:SGNH/GDSL hydrolase family protein [Streptomyces montanisoli]|uniref:SGNH/GDSL hydrolase family protein n=1 Tax=Streptomyces montanisoli TaxID=2798581 RepID=A0A940M9A1_9ACTN|nr:SGNH/GDSL hydrolase family protein [Streptomyces montanisoli]MBP0456718.1 SGNH/GDSL hydrolase family protein [Streptomyces montanisoli]
MQNETKPRRTLIRPRQRRPAAAVAALTMAAGAVLAGCGGSAGTGVRSEPAPSASAHAKDKKVLWLGDSIAGVEALPLGAALKASGVGFRNDSSDGGGTIVEGDKMSLPIARSTWKRLRKDLASYRPDVLAYQITTYDWGTPQQQRASYEKLAKAAGNAGADLVIVSAPPFKVDDFYKKHAADIESAPKAAAKVADADGAKVAFADASALWGTDAGAAKAQRSADGIHSCQQGSAAFAKWFTERLGKRYGFAPAPPDEWATGPWVSNQRYAKLGCK